MGRAQLSEMKSLEKENARLKKIVAELELDKLIIKESLNHLKPNARPQRSFVRPSFTHARSSLRLSDGRAG